MNRRGKGLGNGNDPGDKDVRRSVTGNVPGIVPGIVTGSVSGNSGSFTATGRDVANDSGSVAGKDVTVTGNGVADKNVTGSVSDKEDAAAAAAVVSPEWARSGTNGVRSTSSASGSAFEGPTAAGRSSSASGSAFGSVTQEKPARVGLSTWTESLAQASRVESSGTVLGGGGKGAGCLSRMTVDYAPIGGGAPFSLLTETSPAFWALSSLIFKGLIFFGGMMSCFVYLLPSILFDPREANCSPIFGTN